MTKDVLLKMCSGLSNEEKTATLNELGITDTAMVAEVMALTPMAAAVPVQAPVINAAAQPVQQPAAVSAVAGGNAVTDAAMQQLQAQLETEKTARITAECSAFITEMKAVGKVTPAEEPSVKQLYVALAGSADQTALNSYKASLQARPANPMLQEKVAAAGVQVLGSGAVDTRTETEKEAALVTQILAMTPDGQAAQHALKAGQVPVKGVTRAGGEMMQAVNLPAALKQFAVNDELVTR